MDFLCFFYAILVLFVHNGIFWVFLEILSCFGIFYHVVFRGLVGWKFCCFGSFGSSGCVASTITPLLVVFGNALVVSGSNNVLLVVLVTFG